MSTVNSIWSMQRSSQLQNERASSVYSLSIVVIFHLYAQNIVLTLNYCLERSVLPTASNSIIQESVDKWVFLVKMLAIPKKYWMKSSTSDTRIFRLLYWKNHSWRADILPGKFKPSNLAF